MLTRIDRIQLTTRDAQATAEQWRVVLGAERLEVDVVSPLNASRTRLAVGDSLVEVLEPMGDGPAAEHLKSGRGGPFAAGVATRDVDALARHLESVGIKAEPLGPQLFVSAAALGIPGLNVIVSPEDRRETVGVLNHLYEVTHLTTNPERAAREIARAFALDASHFVPIASDTFGYEGTLTLFDPAQLHRIETIRPHDRDKTMGRYFDRFGPSLYMCYGEVDDIAPLREKLERIAPKDWTGSDDNDDSLFVHPRALGGVMVGISRTSHAWTWSGHPERVVPAG